MMEQIDHTIKIHNNCDCKCINARKPFMVLERPKSNYDPTRQPTFMQIKPSTLPSYFEHRYETRQKVFDYFAKYNTNPIERNRVSAQEIRSIIRSSKTISFCPKRSGKLEYNGGCVLTGDYDVLSEIATTFNERVTKTEFTSLHVVKLSDLTNTGRCVDRCNRYFKMFKMNGINKYVLVGVDAFTGLYKMSFGKREWYPDDVECSRQCAVRELFEEFNVEMSDETFKKFDTGKTIMWGCGIFYLFDISETSVRYESDSDTIFI